MDNPARATVDSLLVEGTVRPSMGALRDMEIPEQLESPRSKLVYLYLLSVVEADIHELNRRLRINYLSLYPTLDLLLDQKLIERDGTRYRCCL